MKPSTSNGKILDYFPNKKRTSALSATDYLSKRIREETQEIQQSETRKQDSLTQFCGDCVEKDKEITELKKTVNLKKRNNELEADNKSLKKLFTKSTQVNFQKDLKIVQLSKENENSARDPLIFKSFEHIFDVSELLTLRSIPYSKERDSSFILQTLQYLYKNDLSLLNLRTASVKKGDKKPISPEKKGIIQKIFNERIKSLNLNGHDFGVRESKINEHIISSIHNIRKSLNHRHSGKKFILKHTLFVHLDLVTLSLLVFLSLPLFLHFFLQLFLLLLMLLLLVRLLMLSMRISKYVSLQIYIRKIGCDSRGG